MIEKFRQRLAAISRVERGVHQFAQVLNARQRLRRVFVLQQLDVAGAVDQKFQNLNSIRRPTRRTKRHRRRWKRRRE